MLQTTKYGLIGTVVGIVLGSVAVGMYSNFTNKGSEPVASGDSIYGGAKTKHNRNYKNHNNKSRKHH